MQEFTSYVTQARTTSLPLPRKKTARVLVVDDEPDNCELLRQVLEGAGYDASAETSPSAALARISDRDVDLIVSDVNMTEMSGLELCRIVVATRPATPVILVTGRGDIDTVTAALRMGARDFLTKPIDADSLLASVAHALEPRPQPSSLDAPQASAGREKPAPLIRGCRGVLGRSPKIQAVYELIANLSSNVSSVLLQGETGTGKEVIAHAIHANSPLGGGPFVALNCAAMPAGLLESELFGHVRGAFTDAKAASKGLLVQANGGTLLLDEIGELPLSMQPKLLRALQERVVRPVGGNDEVRFDCRLIAATNRDLEREVLEKRFREDLFYRIDVVRITVPPLRERGEDILLFAQYFLERFTKASDRNPTLSAAVAEKLLAYSWPGNVRELENCIERAVALTDRAELTTDDLPERVRAFSAPGHAVFEGVADVDVDVMSLSQLERRHILQTVKMLGGNRTLAADLLGIDRRTLYRRLKEYETPGSQ